MEKILVVGNNVRNVVQSARKAGYKVLALTNHFDADLFLYAEKAEQIKSEDKNEVREQAIKLAEEACIVLASGFEDLRLDDVLGSEHKVVEKVVDKLRFYRALEKAGIPFPELVSKNEVENKKTIAKPRKGGGGEDIHFIESDKQERSYQEEYLYQRYIEGVPCSVSLIASERYVMPIAINKMFVGWEEMNADGFRYCGNPVSYTHLTLPTKA